MPVSPRLLSLESPLHVACLASQTDARQERRARTELRRAYRALLEQAPLPAQDIPSDEFVINRRSASKADGYELLVGQSVERFIGVPDSYLAIDIPTGQYAVIPITPVLNNGWWHARLINQARRYLHEVWLPRQGLTANGLEFQFATPSMQRQGPYHCDLYFGLTSTA